MPGGKANIQATNTPPNVEPQPAAITKLHESKEQAEDKPREEHDKRGFQEHSLRLRELLDGVKLSQSLRQPEGIVVNAGISGDGGISNKESAPPCYRIKNKPGCAGTEGAVVGDGIRRTRCH